jgi:hypothetical protein
LSSGLPHPANQAAAGLQMHNPLNFHTPSNDPLQAGVHNQSAGPQQLNPMTRATSFVPGHHSSSSRSNVLSHAPFPSTGPWNMNDRPRRDSFGPLAPQGHSRGAVKGQKIDRKDTNQNGSGVEHPQSYSGARHHHGTDGTNSWHQNTKSALNQESNGQSHCANGHGDHYMYIPCDCQPCNDRNRSVWVKVLSAPSETTSGDLRARVKHGLQERFGSVEEVFLTKTKYRVDMPGYIVR